jgi:hypothetical protein
MSSHILAVVDAIVVEVSEGGDSGTLRIFEPLRSQLGFGYAIFSNREVQTLPMVLTPGRQVRCEIWSATRVPGRAHARNVWVFTEEE